MRTSQMVPLNLGDPHLKLPQTEVPTLLQSAVFRPECPHCRKPASDVAAAQHLAKVAENFDAQVRSIRMGRHKPVAWTTFPAGGRDCLHRWGAGCRPVPCKGVTVWDIIEGVDQDRVAPEHFSSVWEAALQVAMQAPSCYSGSHVRASHIFLLNLMSVGLPRGKVLF